mmetsp:Transcript_20162/g.29929  ORF Transcript_20162/g.29929 Transcript_20162/m.29929 type:complete len:223 (+) Transcript_20162:105-773(+)|eukprot:CAMPEP_0194202094 /NCGR_PEP_ID=MMETSP0156-20130528/2202_1 /TAXON_ID=33649 /ORGANISM="Thalassionema nitzschioides, Strain L26-B" /LENGTH=222 /DNA_ID=CAMNT_0038927475 /DNA_START=68 /DNA_END=736 /DNA_ORIENTATION=-
MADQQEMTNGDVVQEEEQSSNNNEKEQDETTLLEQEKKVEYSEKEKECKEDEPLIEDVTLEKKKNAKEAKTVDAPIKKEDYFGKYQWSGKQENKKAESILGDEIKDYAWSDGKKKVSIYVTVPGLDDLQDEDLSVNITTNDERGVIFEALFPGAVRRRLTIQPLNEEVEEDAKLIRKKGQNMVVIKLKKKGDSPKTWYNLKAGSGGGGIDYSKYKPGDFIPP